MFVASTVTANEIFLSEDFAALTSVENKSPALKRNRQLINQFHQPRLVLYWMNKIFTTCVANKILVDY